MINVSIIDYGVGNVQSLLSAFSKYSNAKLTYNHDEIMKSDAIVFPGVGTFEQAMKGINQRQLPLILEIFRRQKKYILGICLGMQIMFEKSEESPGIKGLSWVPSGEIFKLRKVNKLPHIGWNKVECILEFLGKGLIKQDFDAYFCHSYGVIEHLGGYFRTQALTTYGEECFCSCIKLENNNVYGVQFHPEKSGEKGLTIIENFCKMVSNG